MSSILVASVSTFVLANKTIYMTGSTQQPQHPGACGSSAADNMRGAPLSIVNELALKPRWLSRGLHFTPSSRKFHPSTHTYTHLSTVGWCQFSHNSPLMEEPLMDNNILYLNNPHIQARLWWELLSNVASRFGRVIVCVLQCFQLFSRDGCSRPLSSRICLWKWKGSKNMSQCSTLILPKFHFFVLMS